MIRSAQHTDIDAMLSIWLSASIRAHDFVPADFWESQLDDMRTMYLPASQSVILEQDTKVIGFCSLYNESLAALFVAPQHQGKGIGSKLINYAKSQHTQLSLTVYKKNQASTDFYLKHGFIISAEQVDPRTHHEEWMMVWHKSSSH